jgi:lipoprotein-releasing system ATP-binding protein
VSDKDSTNSGFKATDNNIIVIRNLMKVYKGGVDVVALDSINLDIKGGEFLAIVGPSGSGKSTLLNMIGLLDTPTSGQILLKGIDVTKISPNDRARLRNEELGFVFQYHHLIPEFTALENVMMPMLIAGKNKTEAKDQAKALLDDVGLGDRMGSKPSQLSGGQNQRVAVARALVNRPSVVIGDDHKLVQVDIGSTDDIIHSIDKVLMLTSSSVPIFFSAHCIGRAGCELNLARPM